MAFEANSGIQVANHYGPRDTGGSVGVERTTKSLNVFSVEITGKALKEGFVSPFVMPKQAHMLRAYLTVDQAFPAGFTSFAIGEGDAPATNGVTVVRATDLAAVGVVDISADLAGTWAVADGNETTRASRVGLTVTGGTAIADAGLCTITIEYLYKTRDDSNWEPDVDTFPSYPAQA